MHDANFFRDLLTKFRLTILLVLDKRVAIYLKLIPLASVIYLVVPDLVIGPIDDAVVIMGAMQLFITLCPQELVDEHSKHLKKNDEATKQSSVTIVESKPTEKEK